MMQPEVAQKFAEIDAKIDGLVGNLTSLQGVMKVEIDKTEETKIESDTTTMTTTTLRTEMDRITAAMREANFETIRSDLNELYNRMASEVAQLKASQHRQDRPDYDMRFGKNMKLDKFSGKSTEGFRSWSQQIEICIKGHGFMKTGDIMKWIEAHPLGIIPYNEVPDRTETVGLANYDFAAANKGWMGKDGNEHMAFNVTLYSILLINTEDEAQSVIMNGEKDDGINAWKRLKTLYDPKTLGQAMDYQKKAMKLGRAKTAAGIMHGINELEDLARKYKEHRKDHKEFDETTKTCILYQILPERTETSLKLEFRNEEVSYDKLKKGIITWLQSDTSGNAPMDLGNLGGDKPKEGEEDEPWPEHPDGGDLDALAPKGKGKGKGEYQGKCYECGEWGHTAKYCKHNNHKGGFNNYKGQNKGAFQQNFYNKGGFKGPQKGWHKGNRKGKGYSKGGWGKGTYFLPEAPVLSAWSMGGYGWPPQPSEGVPALALTMPDNASEDESPDALLNNSFYLLAEKEEKTEEIKEEIRELSEPSESPIPFDESSFPVLGTHRKESERSRKGRKEGTVETDAGGWKTKKSQKETRREREYERKCEDEDAELEKMAQSLPDHKTIKAEEDEKRRARIIPVSKPPQSAKVSEGSSDRGRYGSKDRFAAKRNMKETKGMPRLMKAEGEGRTDEDRKEYGRTRMSELQKVLENKKKRREGDETEEESKRKKEDAEAMKRAIRKIGRTDGQTDDNDKTKKMIDKAEEVIKEMNVLTKHQAEGINVLDANEWRRFPSPLIIDSGAAETVLPSSWFANYKMRQSAGSLAGVFYQTANGEPIYNEGEKTLMMMNEAGQMRQMTFQCAATTKALGSVSKICSNGNRVVFDDEGSYIQNKITGEKLWLEQTDGVYHLDMHVAPEGWAGGEGGFGRQGP